MQYEFNEDEIKNFVDEQVENIFAAIDKKDYKYKDIFYKNLKVDWRNELIYIPFNPKTPLASFA